jgi:hypothetical protein
MSALFKTFRLGLSERDNETLNKLANKLLEVGSGDIPIRTKWAHRIRVSSPGLSDAESKALADHSILSIGASISSGSASSQSTGQLLSATQAMQGTQMSFNMQYLQLQNSMQNDNRQFTMVSNIMKAKHGTVKCSISNIH